MTSKSAVSEKQLRPIRFPSAKVARGFRARRGQIKRRLVELAGIQHRSELRGDHQRAARALKERRYLEFVIQLLEPRKSNSPVRYSA